MTRDEAIEKAISARSDTATKLRLCGDGNGDDLNGDEIMRRAYAAFHTSLAASGFAVVPKKPTDKMLVSGQRSFVEWEESIDQYSANCVTFVYLAMLAAAREDRHE